MSPRPPLGIANNNPGNIRPTPTMEKNPFIGTVPESLKEDYLKFEAPYFGIRASGVCVLQAHLIHGVDTLLALGDLWAPIEDNPKSFPGDYGKDLGRILLIDPSKNIDFNLWLESILHAFFTHENGKDPFNYVPSWYPPILYGAGCDAARYHLKIPFKSFTNASPSRFIIRINRGV